MLAGVVRPVLNLVLRRNWTGTENFPRGRGIIVCPNHNTEIDPLVVGHYVYNQGILPHFLAKASLFKIPVVGQLLSGARQIPVERSSRGPTAPCNSPGRCWMRAARSSSIRKAR